MNDAELEIRIEEARQLREQFADVEPQQLAWNDAGHMAVTWSDGLEATYSPQWLRAICPCAECRGAHGGPPKAFNIVSSSNLRNANKQTVIQRVEPIGSYAMAIVWGDGHKEGIYSWTYLRALADAG